MNKSEFNNLSINLKIRVELSNCLVRKKSYKWYNFKKRIAIKKNINLILSTYNVSELYYI